MDAGLQLHQVQTKAVKTVAVDKEVLHVGLMVCKQLVDDQVELLMEAELRHP